MDLPISAIRKVVWSAVCVLAAVSLSACSGDRPPAPGGQGDAAAVAETSAASPSAMPLRRGHLVFGHEVRSFEPCGSEGALWVLDETGGELARVYEELTYEPYQRLYVEILGRDSARPDEGFGAEYDRSITVTALRHAASESLACEWELSGVVMRASGNEPFWHVEVRPGEILLSELGEEDRLFSLAPSESREDGLLQFRGTAVRESGQPPGAVILVTVDEHLCRDSMSGAFFSFAARVEVDGRTLAGCARRGW